jgi:aspartyl-tRNA(Asn)/glutamyl-tRNA(Gln) amidotransferase subunit A
MAKQSWCNGRPVRLNFIRAAAAAGTNGVLSMSEFSKMSVADLSRELGRKAFSPTELLRDVLQRYEKLEPELNMFAYFDREGALAQAEASERRIMQGEKLGELDGIPTSVKDLIAVKNMPMRFGSKSSSADPVAIDAPAVERLRAAGAVILGKSTTSEFGCKAVGDSPLSGVTRNPLDPNLTPGGSSAGSAAMVAAGLVPYAIGTDGGGSIRIPAALTGIFGIKAQFGRVPVYPVSATPTLAHVGPLTRSPDDAATVLGVISGFDRRDPFSVRESVPDFNNAVAQQRDLRIAWSPTMGFGRVDSDVAVCTAAAVARLERLGYNIEQVDVLDADPIEMWTSEFYAGVGTRLRGIIDVQPELLDPAVLKVLQQALQQEMQSYYESVFARYAFREKMRQVFDKFDILLTPTLPVSGVEVGRDVPEGYEDKSIVSWATFTYPFNLTGNPAASMPVGLTSKGRPAALQVVGATFDEASIFSLCGAIQREGMS